MSQWSEKQANADADLKRRVTAFLQDQYFPSFKFLEIDVDAGAVTLTGTVRSFHERQVVLKTREHVAGIERLFDFIRVGQIPKPTPEASTTKAEMTPAQNMEAHRPVELVLVPSI